MLNLKKRVVNVKNRLSKLTLKSRNFLKKFRRNRNNRIKRIVTKINQTTYQVTKLVRKGTKYVTVLIYAIYIAVTSLVSPANAVDNFYNQQNRSQIELINNLDPGLFLNQTSMDFDDEKLAAEMIASTNPESESLAKSTLSKSKNSPVKEISINKGIKESISKLLPNSNQLRVLSEFEKPFLPIVDGAFNPSSLPRRHSQGVEKSPMQKLVEQEIAANPARDTKTQLSAKREGKNSAAKNTKRSAKGKKNQSLQESCEIVYRIKENPALIREAKNMGKDSKAQTDVNHLIEQLSLGNENPGIGTERVKGVKDVSEARARNEGRVYFRKKDGKIEVLAKSNKDNQDKVIGILQKMGY